MIRIDSIWLATQPMDMRAGTDTALARVVAVFGAAKPHCAYLFANRRANRMKVLVHDQASRHAAPQHLIEQPAEQAAVTEAAVAILREGRVIGYFVFQTQPAEPAIGQV